jgi:hypothetical protein
MNNKLLKVITYVKSKNLDTDIKFVIEPADATGISKTSVRTERIVSRWPYTHTASSDSFGLPPSRSVEITSHACMSRCCANLDPFRLVHDTLTVIAGLCSPHTHGFQMSQNCGSFY